MWTVLYSTVLVRSNSLQVDYHAFAKPEILFEALLYLLLSLGSEVHSLFLFLHGFAHLFSLYLFSLLLALVLGFLLAPQEAV